ncbi:hypothetical protein AGMMS49974_07760 [Deltaproteobacteria bacterium]|nr:hypothetical protein AGMMS49974_07760 [Deltaproteobacteria bacterium]
MGCQRITAPYHALLADALRETDKRLHPFRQRRQAGLKAFSLIIIEREVKIKCETRARDTLQPGQEEGGVFAPEYKNSTARAQAFKKPFHMQSGDVRGAACRDDKRGNGAVLPIGCGNAGH